MDNETREAVYLRDRSALTPAQRRRVKHRAHADAKNRIVRRRARHDVVRADTARSRYLRVAFRSWRRAK